MYLPNQPSTNYRTHSWIFLNFCILFFLVVLWLFCLPHDFSACGASCVSFSLSLINCQSSSLSPSVSVLLSIFLLILCSILEEREGRKKPHRLNNPVFIRDLFRFFLCTVPPLIVAASSGFFFFFFFWFPQTNSITLPAVRTLFKTVPSGRKRKENCAFPLQRTKPSQICASWYENKQVLHYINCCNEWDKQNAWQDNTSDLHTGWSQKELDLRTLLPSQSNIHVSTRRIT